MVVILILIYIPVRSAGGGLTTTHGISTDTLKNLSAAFVGECHAAIRANGQEVVFKNWDNRIYCFGNQILRFISYRN